MKASREQLNHMERFMMKLLICVMVVSAAIASVPLYMLHEADLRRVAAAPVEQPDNASIIR